MKELTVKRKGILTEEYLKLWFLQQGYSVSVPIGDDDRYDFIVDFDGKLVKMQSKTGNLTRHEGCLNFASASIKYNSKGSQRVHYTKEDIIEGYLNTINYGGIFGVENASKYYFGKSASDLSIAEASLLAGIPNRPSEYSPFVNLASGKKSFKLSGSLV